MADPIITVSERLAPAFAKVAGLKLPTFDPVVRRSDRADAQVNGSLALAKQMGKSPREVAKAIVEAAELGDICSEVEVAGPGFLNLTFSNEFLATELALAAEGPRLGVRIAAVPLVAVVDYSAPNVAKEMHVGHLRSTVIGDALVRMLAFVGHDVIRENHI
ncbi:MAG: arginine--tRNA ligase, partial [Ilumatobacteraceae bacterium]